MKPYSGMAYHPPLRQRFGASVETDSVDLFISHSWSAGYQGFKLKVYTPGPSKYPQIGVYGPKLRVFRVFRG